jgi:predicted nucleic acid-binding protein
MSPGPYLFDSHALLVFFQKEKGYHKVFQLLEKTPIAETAKFLNAINLGEIIYIVKREFGDRKKMEILAHIARMGLTILPVPNALIFQAAEYKAQYPLSYADCFVLASALEKKAVIVTGDPEFKKVEHLVDIFWVD